MTSQTTRTEIRVDGRTFHWHCTNDGASEAINNLMARLLDMQDGATTVVNGWTVTRWTKETFEVGTWGRDVVFLGGAETTAEALASSDNNPVQERIRC